MQTRKRVIPLLAVGTLTALGLLVFKSRHVPPNPPLPSPNGYDDFMKAGRMLVSSRSDYGTMNQAELQALMTKNAESLQLVRKGLTRRCRVPVIASQTYIAGHVSELGGIKHLAQVLVAEGRLAELESRQSDAMQAYIAAMRLGHEATRGGVLIDGLVRLACEAVGLSRLRSLATSLDAQECHEVIRALEAIDANEDPFEMMMQHERDFVRSAYPFYQRMVGQISRLLNINSTKQIVQRVALKFKTQELKRRELLVEVAARAFELKTGQRPKQIEELAPDYLKAIPRDPLTGTNLIYKP